jgi:UDP-glucose 4-epimerase
VAQHILITGGEGFVGTQISKLLQKSSNLDVYLSTSHYQNSHQKFVFYMDLADHKSISNLISHLKPKIIIHTAALLKENDPFVDFNVNLLGSLYLLREACNNGLERFIFSSSGGAIYGEVPFPHAAKPDWPVRPLSPYATSKLAFEQYLHTFSRIYGFEYNILRYSNIIGKNQPKKGEGLLLSILLEKAKANLPLTIFGREVAGDEGCFRDYVDVADVAMANLLCVQGAISEKIINISSGRGISTLQLAQSILEYISSNAKIELLPPRPNEVKRSVLDNSDIKKYMEIQEFDAVIQSILKYESSKT